MYLILRSIIFALIGYPLLFSSDESYVLCNSIQEILVELDNESYEAEIEIAVDMIEANEIEIFEHKKKLEKHRKNILTLATALFKFIQLMNKSVDK